MKKLLIGRSPLTTVAGYLVAILMSVHQVTGTGPQGWQDILLPAAIALFGRIAGDDNKQPPLPPIPQPLPEEPVLPPTMSTAFQRRGREHQQKRGRNGRFAPATI